MGNTNSQTKDTIQSDNFNSVSDHLNHLVAELIYVERAKNSTDFVTIINALNRILSGLLHKTSNDSIQYIDEYDLDLQKVKNWSEHNNLLNACYIKMNRNKYFARSQDKYSILRSLLTTVKYCLHQKIQIEKISLQSTLDIFETRNQVDDFFIVNASSLNSLKFPDGSVKSNETLNSKKLKTPINTNNSYKTTSSKISNDTESQFKTNSTKINSTLTNLISDPLPPKSLGSRRLYSERKQFLANKVEGIRLLQDLGRIWIIEIDGAKNTLYENETFTVRFTFEDNYPIESPEVIFLKDPPVHPHIYSNGSICLSILYDGWSPALGVVPVCMSLISMLSSCKKKKKPDDDRSYSNFMNMKPKETPWYFHDDKV